MQQKCRLSTPFESVRLALLRGCRLNTPFKSSMSGTLQGCRASSAKKAPVTKCVGGVGAAWRRWPVGGGNISSLSSPTLDVRDTCDWCLYDWVGVGVCGGVPFGVPHAPFPLLLARDKYIAPLNLQKSSNEVKS